MAILKCKMCGGDLNITAGMTICECEYCCTKQTVPSLDDDKKATMFTRANRLRIACEFDKAYGVYESIVADYPEEAEAYWGLILCKYGIEYVDDPATARKVPTCHRTSFESLMDDPNYEMVLEYSDMGSRLVYRDEAKVIEEIRKGIIEISNREEQYDIFICYKETDLNGARTIDSVIAQDVYKELTNEGYRVFFSRITLEDKLGQEYEPYIFAALHSAKVMLTFGTDYEYFNSVWVKNEWSRYLQLIAQGEKKVLIPCYKGIDAYDMPKEFSKLQAQDMGKVGAIQDLVRGIGKIITKDTKSSSQANPEEDPNELIKRGYGALEFGVFNDAKYYFSKALSLSDSNSEALLGLFLVEASAKNKDDAKERFIKNDYLKNEAWIKCLNGATGALKNELQGWVSDKEKYDVQNRAKRTIISLISIVSVVLVVAIILSVTVIIPMSKYNSAIDLMNNGQVMDAIAEFESLGDYKDSESKIIECQHMGAYFKTYDIGDEIVYGNYGSPITWTVLDIEEDRMLVLCTYEINTVRYSKDKVSWKYSELREWLNTEFYNEAFNSVDQSKILTTTLQTDIFEILPDETQVTDDRIFALSLDELDEYLPEETQRICEFDGSPCDWWLRSTDYRVSKVGKLVKNKFPNVNVTVGVRPAMWIDLK